MNNFCFVNQTGHTSANPGIIALKLPMSDSLKKYFWKTSLTASDVSSIPEEREIN